jgi:hypothetical protein
LRRRERDEIVRRSVAVARFVALLLASPVQAQSVRLGPQGIAESNDLGRAFETFAVFGGIPGIAAARYNSDFSLNSYQLPIPHSFEPIANGPLAGFAPYAEVTFGYLTAAQTFALEGGPTTPKSVKLSFDSWSALVGAGFEVPIHGLKLRPIILAGYAHVGGDSSFFGPNSAFFQTAVGGVLNNAAVNTALLGGALELVYEAQFDGDLSMTARARYNELAAIVTGATSPLLNQNGSFGVANGGVRFSGPTEWQVAAHAIRWIGYVNGTWLPNTNRGTLGFNAFAEIGGGLQLPAPDLIRGVQGGTVRASAIVGPGVTGWLVSAALDF